MKFYTANGHIDSTAKTLYAEMMLLQSQFRKDLALKTTVFREIVSWSSSLRSRSLGTTVTFLPQSGMRGEDGLLLYVAAWGMETFVNPVLVSNACKRLAFLIEENPGVC